MSPAQNLLSPRRSASDKMPTSRPDEEDQIAHVFSAGRRFRVLRSRFLPVKIQSTIARAVHSQQHNTSGYGGDHRSELAYNTRDMTRYDDRHSSTRLYVGHLSSRTRTRDLEDLFARYGRVRAVDMKRDYAFVEYGDARDADDARYSLDGKDFKGSRIVVEFSKGAPRGPGGSRDYLGRGPPPGSGRCFNCGIDGHWARDCKAGDWKNKCYRCGDRGHIERNCPSSPKKLSRERKYSRSPSPRRGRSRSRSFTRSHSYSRSPSPVKRERERSYEDVERRPRSPDDSRSPPKRGRSPSPRGRRVSPGPDERSPRGRADESPENQKWANGSDYGNSPRGRSRSRSPVDDADTGGNGNNRSPVEENGHDRSPSPTPRDEDSRGSDVDDNNGGSSRGSE